MLSTDRDEEESVIIHPLEKKEKKKENESKPDFTYFIFDKPKIVEESTSSLTALPISKIKLSDMGAKNPLTIVVKNNIGKTFIENSKINETKEIPNMEWFLPNGRSETVGNIIKEFLSVFKGKTPLTTASSEEDFTTHTVLNRKFKVSQELYDAVKMLDISSITFRTDTDTSIISVINDNVVLIHVAMKDNEPHIFHVCTCDEPSNTISKETMAVLATNAPIILATLDRLMQTDLDFDNTLSYWNQRITTYLSTTDEYKKASFIYYFYRFLQKRGLLYNVELDDEKKKLLEELKNPAMVSKYIENKLELGGNIAKELLHNAIVWTKEMEELREKMLNAIDEISLKFGIKSKSLSDKEWPIMLMFGATKIADYREPPANIHVIGKMGTFKTTGGKILSEYIEIPILEANCECSDYEEKYNKVLELIEKHFGVPANTLEKKIGGIIYNLAGTEKGFKIAFSLPHIYSIAKNRESIEMFYKELKALNFTIKESKTKLKLGTVDISLLANIDDYRTTYVIDNKFGPIEKKNIFDNHLLIIDEASRSASIENMLTKSSLVNIDESLKLVIFTDNIEPALNTLSKQELDAFHDRTYMVLVSSIRDDRLVEEYFNKPAINKFNALELIAMNRFIESIPVDEGIYYIIRTLEEALANKFEIRKFIYIIEGIVFTLDRSKTSEAETDYFEGIDFRFIDGGRFREHTISLARFFAFLNHHNYVTVEDTLEALKYTVLARLSFKVRDNIEYQERILRILSKLSSISIKSNTSESKIDEIIKVYASFSALLESGNTEEINNSYSNLLHLALKSNQLILPALINTLIDKYSSIDINKLPLGVKATLAHALISKNKAESLPPDLADLIINISKEVVKSEQD